MQLSFGVNGLCKFKIADKSTLYANRYQKKKLFIHKQEKKKTL